MSLATKAFAAQSALVTLLDTALTTWDVAYGVPLTRPAKPSAFVAEDVTDWTRETPLSGAVTSQDESFTLTAYLYLKQLSAPAVSASASAAAIRDAMASAAATVDAAIAAAPTLSGAVDFARIASLEYVSGITEDGGSREAQMTLRVDCTAYIG
jgi:hypothetical protein